MQTAGNVAPLRLGNSCTVLCWATISSCRSSCVGAKVSQHGCAYLYGDLFGIWPLGETIDFWEGGRLDMLDDWPKMIYPPKQKSLPQKKQSKIAANKASREKAGCFSEGFKPKRFNSWPWNDLVGGQGPLFIIPKRSHTHWEYDGIYWELHTHHHSYNFNFEIHLGHGDTSSQFHVLCDLAFWMVVCSSSIISTHFRSTLVLRWWNVLEQGANHQKMNPPCFRFEYVHNIFVPILLESEKLNQGYHPDSSCNRLFHLYDAALRCLHIFRPFRHQLRVGSLSHSLLDFIHPWWLLGISSINSKMNVELSWGNFCGTWHVKNAINFDAMMGSHGNHESVWLGAFQCFWGLTLPKTKTAPENWWLEDDISFWNGLFSGAMLVCFSDCRTI